MHADQDRSLPFVVQTALSQRSLFFGCHVWVDHCYHCVCTPPVESRLETARPVQWWHVVSYLCTKCIVSAAWVEAFSYGPVPFGLDFSKNIFRASGRDSSSSLPGIRSCWCPLCCWQVEGTKGRQLVTACEIRALLHGDCDTLGRSWYLAYYIIMTSIRVFRDLGLVR